MKLTDILTKRNVATFKKPTEPGNQHQEVRNISFLENDLIELEKMLQEAVGGAPFALVDMLQWFDWRGREDNIAVWVLNVEGLPPIRIWKSIPFTDSDIGALMGGNRVQIELIRTDTENSDFMAMLALPKLSFKNNKKGPRQKGSDEYEAN